jgi:RND family efflux transporter MFP subunit
MGWRVGWIVMVLLGACSHAPEEATAPVEAEAPVAVETTAAEAAELDVVTAYQGTFVADASSRVAADANGRVVRILVERGERVAAGQALVEVDADTARLSAAAGAAQVALAEAQRTALEADCARYQKLFEEGAISAAQLDRSKAQCEAQARSVDAASAQARIAERNAEHTLVRAPFAGVVEERLVDVGEFVGASSPVIALVKTDPVRVRFAVPERELAAVLAAGEVTVRAAAVPDRTFPATLLPTPPSGREQSRDVVLEAKVANPDGALLPGLSATVELAGGKQPAVAVPSGAVVADDTVHRVFVVKEGVARETLVHVERLADGRLAVSPGVNVGDAVVLAPPAGLRDGAAVR